MKRVTYDDVLPYLHFEDEVYILKDGQVVFGLAIEGCQYEDCNYTDLLELNKKINRFINELPGYANLMKMDIYFKDKQNISVTVGTDENSMIRKTWLSLADKPAMQFRSFLFLEISPDVKEGSPLTTFFSRMGKSISSKMFKDIDRRKAECRSFGYELQAMLNDFKDISAQVMDFNDFDQLKYQFANLRFTGDCNAFEASVDNTMPGQMCVGRKKVTILSLQEQGEEFCIGSKKEYLPDRFVIHPLTFSIGLDLQIPHITIVNLRKREKEEGLKQFRTEAQITGMIPEMPITKGIADRHAVVEEILSEINRGNDCLCDLGVSVIVWNEDSKEHSRYVEMASGAFKKIENCKVLEENIDTCNLYFSLFPGNGSQHYRRILVPSKIGVGYLSFQRGYDSDPNGVIVTDRFGNPMLIDLRLDDGRMPAQNWIEVGPTGSGKSVTQGALISQAYQRGEIVVILDKGGTYKNLIEQLDGEYFENSEERPFKFNPFLVPWDADKREYIFDEDRVILIRTLIAALWKNKDAKEEFSSAESSLVMKFVPLYYHFASECRRADEKYVPTLRRFCEWVLTYKTNDTKGDIFDSEMELFDVNAFWIVMQPYIDGIYGKILSSEDALSLSDHRLLCFDMAKVQADKVLYPIIAMLLIDVILQHIAKFPDVYKNVVLDEAWSFLTGNMEEFIEMMYRTVRKNNGNVGIITQAVTDIEDSAIGTALLNNTHVLIALNHEGSDIDKLAAVLNLTDDEKAKVSSMRKRWKTWDGRRGGRELFIKRKGIDSKVVALEVPIELMPVLTSNPKERNHFNRLKTQYSFNRAIQEWVKDFHAGAIT
jgi:type IV secretory pathway VirB4 component